MIEPEQRFRAVKALRERTTALIGALRETEVEQERGVDAAVGAAESLISAVRRDDRRGRTTAGERSDAALLVRLTKSGLSA